MKRISLFVAGEVVGEDLSSVAAIRSKAEKQTYDANNDAQAAKARETALEYSEAATTAERAAIADVRERAAALVEALREAGVRVTAANLLFGPRPGSHEQTETVDLLAKPVEQEQATGPAGEQAGEMATSGDDDGSAVPGA